MDQFYDTVIIGGGPAGLTAAIYLARAKYRVLVVEKDHFGGQITITAELVNYPGVERTSGTALTDTMRKQAEHFGAEFMIAQVKELSMGQEVNSVKTTRGEIKCFGILLATGACPRMIGFRGEEEFRGRGVAYCATCDGEFFTGKEVFVVGGGFAAAEESVFLTKYASHVTILVRGDDFSCAASVCEPAKHHENITVLYHTEVEEVLGGTCVDTIRFRNKKTGEVQEKKDAAGIGVFVFAGYEPETGLMKGLAQLDDHGYVLTDRCQRTNIKGLYAAGDVCVKSLRQVVTAVGDGALAATELERYAADMQRKTGLVPKRPQQKGYPKEPGAQNAAKAEPQVQNAPGMETGAAVDSLFDGEMLAQLQGVFEKMEQPLKLCLYLDDTAVSGELKAYVETLCSLTDKLTWKQEEREESHFEASPCVKILRQDDSDTGLAFHGAPGGHEFTSFVLGLYNASGPGQAIDPETLQQIQAISVPVKLQIFVSLSCTMCPDLVVAAQHLAALNPCVIAEVYDLNHFPGLRERYQVMSVPCLVINEEKVSFGKKNIGQILELIGAAVAISVKA